MRIAFATLKSFLAVLALAGYVANGAQTHLSIQHGETLSLQLCGGGDARTITLEIQGGEADFEAETCCGDCLSSGAIITEHPPLNALTVQYVLHLKTLSIKSISPRSPLWPGAPPQGPPAFHNV